MFDKNKSLEFYTRDQYTFAENLYKHYIEMRKSTADFERLKYSLPMDSFPGSKEGKEGFIAGVYVMLSLIGDM